MNGEPGWSWGHRPVQAHRGRKVCHFRATLQGASRSLQVRAGAHERDAAGYLAVGSTTSPCVSDALVGAAGKPPVVRAATLPCSVALTRRIPMSFYGDAAALAFIGLT
jgi:hypothetical protein